MLWLYQRTMFGKLDNPANESLRDLTLRELAAFLPLLLLAFGIGLYPKPFLAVLDKPVAAIVRVVNPGLEQRPLLTSPAAKTGSIPEAGEGHR
jgi:NADH-quinone oxidoreductase subunit M